MTRDEDPAVRGARLTERLKEVVLVLAADPEDQLARFPDFVVKADELCLDYSAWAYEFVPQLVEGGWIPAHAVPHLDAIDAAFARMTDRPDEGGPVWTDDGVRTHPAWVEVRRLAKVALAALEVPGDGPVPGAFMTYVSCGPGPPPRGSWWRRLMARFRPHS